MSFLWFRTVEPRDATPAGSYPLTAAAMAAAVGYGTWSHGYLLDETSGNLSPVFGSGNLTAAGTPTYSTAGPLGGADLAVGADGASDYFTADDGKQFQLGATDDLCVAWVGYGAPTMGSSQSYIAIKSNGSTSWILGANSNAAGGEFFLKLDDGTNTPTATATATAGGESRHRGLWHVGIAVRDVTADKIRIGTVSLDNFAIVSSEVTDTTTTAIGDDVTAFTLFSNGQAPVGFNLAAIYFGKGASAASTMSTNLATALANFRSQIMTFVDTAVHGNLLLLGCG